METTNHCGKKPLGAEAYENKVKESCELFSAELTGGRAGATEVERQRLRS